MTQINADRKRSEADRREKQRKRELLWLENLQACKERKQLMRGVPASATGDRERRRCGATRATIIVVLCSELYAGGIILVVTPMRFQALIVAIAIISWAVSCSSKCCRTFS